MFGFPVWTSVSTCHTSVVPKFVRTLDYWSNIRPWHLAFWRMFCVMFPNSSYSLDLIHEFEFYSNKNSRKLLPLKQVVFFNQWKKCISIWNIPSDFTDISVFTHIYITTFWVHLNSKKAYRHSSFKFHNLSIKCINSAQNSNVI